MNLTTEQKSAAESHEQVTVVSAAAGSGKTQLLAFRAAELANRYPSDPILCLVFTRGAAQNLRARIDALAPETGTRVRVSTFHAYAASWLQDAGLMRRVATEAESGEIIRSLVEGPTRVSPSKTKGIEALEQDIINHEAGRSVANRQLVHLARMRARECKVFPTWDLLPSLNLPECPRAHVIVDEAQDMTTREYLTAQTLSEGFTLTMVGDPRQSIMEFRGAGTEALDNPTHRLTHSFRFGKAIAAYANSIAAKFGGEPILGASDPVSSIKSGASMGATHVDCERMFEASEAMVPGGAHLVRRDFIGQDDDIGDPFEEAWANGRPTISTVHAMKGREADSVCFPYAASQFKNDYSLRMCYVAATRARSELTTTDGVFK